MPIKVLWIPAFAGMTTVLFAGIAAILFRRNNSF